MQKKAIEKPALGIFYLVPNKQTGKYEIISELEDKENPLHLFLWQTVLLYLKKYFKKRNTSKIDTDHLGIPRGRIIENRGEWIVLYGADFPLNEYKNEILSIFKLHDYNSLGKVTFERSLHESMDKNEKARVEKFLNIEITNDGFKIKD